MKKLYYKNNSNIIVKIIILYIMYNALEFSYRFFSNISLYFVFDNSNYNKSFYSNLQTA